MTSDVLFADNTVNCKSSQSYVMKLLEELKINLNQDNDVIIQYNNQQTLYLIKAEIRKLFIKLKHVDIYNH